MMKRPAHTLVCNDNLTVIQQLLDAGVRAQLVYLDPPYNTGRLRGARKSFRDTARHAWSDRVRQVVEGAGRLLDDRGFLAVSINQTELFRLKSIVDEVLGAAHLIGLFPVKIRHGQRQLMINATFHDLFEYLLIYRKRRSVRFFTTHQPARTDKFVYSVRPLADPAQTRQIKGKKVEIYPPGTYEIVASGPSKQALRRYVIAGKLATANWSGEWYETHLRSLGVDHLIRVWGLEKDGLGYRWFQTGNGRRRSGVYFQSQQNAGRPLLPTNDLDYTEVVPGIYKEGGPGCDFKDSKKPEAMLRFLLEICTRPGDLVLDLYAGSGTTLAAAIKMRRRAIVVENDPAAVTIIRRRVENLASGADPDGPVPAFHVDVVEAIGS